MERLTIDEIIQHCENKSVYLANKSIDMVDAVNKGYADGYNKAIDDAVQVIEDSKSLYDNSRHSSMGEKDRLQNLIKKLKVGGENE